MYRDTRHKIYNFNEIPAFDKRKPRKISKARVALRKYVRLYKYLAFLVVLIFSIYLTQKYLVSSDRFRIAHTEVYGTKNFVNHTDLETLLRQHVFGRYYFSIDTKIVEKVLTENFQGAREMHVRKQFPSTVIVEVVERVPLAIVTNPKSDTFYLVDEAGYILGIVDKDNTNLPIIEYNDVLHVGLMIDKSVVPIYLELLTSIDREKLNASTISIQPKYFSFFVDENIEIAIGRDKSITKSVTIISNLLKQLKLEGKDVKKIDLRYDKVVVGLNE